MLEKLVWLFIILIIIDWEIQKPTPELQPTGSLPISSLIDKIDTTQLKPAFLLWRTGINRSGSELMAENIFPIQNAERKIWRITHFGVDPIGSELAGYDYYDVEDSSLRPIISTMRNPPSYLYRIDFGANKAEIELTDQGKTTKESITISEHLYPEGPGTQLLLASLPLKEGFMAQYTCLDRWRKPHLAIYKTKVIGKEQLSIQAGKFETYILETESQNGFYTKIWVLAKAPHYQLRVEYLRPPNMILSEVQQFTISGK